jgi:hypothetical protein
MLRCKAIKEPVNMVPVRVSPSSQTERKGRDMKKSVLITTAALLVVSASGVYAQSSDSSTHHRWTHARERIAPHANSMASAPDAGYRSVPGAVGDEAGDNANSLSGPDSADEAVEGRTGG